MRPNKRPDVRRGRRSDPGVLRGVTDELGITTPKEADRRRRKGPMRVKVYKDQQR